MKRSEQQQALNGLSSDNQTNKTANARTRQPETTIKSIEMNRDQYFEQSYERSFKILAQTIA